MDRYMAVGKDLFICFIDYQKAFDRVLHDQLVQSLIRLNIDPWEKRFITTFYWNQSARIRTEGGSSSSFPIERGVRQGCVLSPKLFNLYTEEIFCSANDIGGCRLV